MFLNHPQVWHDNVLIEAPGEPWVFDLEWSYDDVRAPKITIVGMAASGKSACSTTDVQRGLAAVKGHNGTLIGHNVIDADFDVMQWSPQSFASDRVFDTRVVGHLIHPHLAELGLLNLGSLVRYYRPTMNWKLDKADPMEYNGRDCAYNYRLWGDLRDDLDKTQQSHLVEKQQRLAHMAVLMRRRGIKVCSDSIREFDTAWANTRRSKAESFPFNPNSPKQIIKWAASQGISLAASDYDTLSKHKSEHDLIIKLMEYKDEGKSIAVWFNGESAERGFIYPTFSVTGTAVARFACSGPNCQNIPDYLRYVIIPRDKDSEIVSYDFSQIENRIVAWWADDKTMLSDFATGADFHRLSASRIYNKRPGDITAAERKEGKITIHATNYLETAYHLAERLYGNRRHDSVSKARDLQLAYFRAYPRIKEWHDRIAAHLDSGDITVRNAFGRLRCVYAQNTHERAKRGCHFLGCSTAADIVNQRALDVMDATGLLPILIVHDELVYEMPRGDTALRQRVREILEQPVSEIGGLAIPVKQKAGPNYGRLTES